MPSPIEQFTNMQTALAGLNQGGSEALLTFGVPDMPHIKQDDDIGEIIAGRMALLGGLTSGDIVLVASKAVSWSEERDCRIDLSKIIPGPEAFAISEKVRGKKTPELVQLIMDESVPGTLEVIEKVPVIIGINKVSGCRITSSGVDKLGLNNREAMILPRNPDASAKRIMDKIKEITLAEVAVILTDSEGRADRLGAGAIAVACAGIDPLRVTFDNSDKKAEETIVDFLANSAAILMGQRDKGVPAVVIRGHNFTFNPNANLKAALHHTKDGKTNTL